MSRLPLPTWSTAHPATSGASTSHRGHLVRFVVALLALLLLAGCGVPSDAAPRPLTLAEIPLSLSSAAPPDQPGPGRIALYFLRDGKITLATREVPESVPTADLLDRLFEGPTPSEKDKGFSSLLVGVKLSGVVIRGGIATVSLAGSSDQLSAASYAQVVVTLDGRDLATRFRLNGADVKVPRGDSNLTDDPLTRQDYASLLAPTAKRPQASASVASTVPTAAASGAPSVAPSPTGPPVFGPPLPAN